MQRVIHLEIGGKKYQKRFSPRIFMNNWRVIHQSFSPGIWGDQALEPHLMIEIREQI